MFEDQLFLIMDDLSRITREVNKTRIEASDICFWLLYLRHTINTSYWTECIRCRPRMVLYKIVQSKETRLRGTSPLQMAEQKQEGIR